MSNEDLLERIAALEAKVVEVEAMATLALRLLSIEKPVAALLERYGASQTESSAVHAFLDDMAQRAAKGGMYEPSFGGFEQVLYERFPAVRGDREFVGLLLDTLKLDRPTYRSLHAYALAQHWLPASA